MSRKKKRGVSTLYSESKVKVGVSLTPTGARLLSTTAKELGLSRSEFVERIARGDFRISGDGQATTITLATNAPAAPAESDESQSAPPVSEMSEVRSATAEGELQQGYEALEQRAKQQADTIRDLEQQLAQLAELETRLKNSVDADTHRQLQDELKQQKKRVSDLQNQLEIQLKNSVDADGYRQLQEQLKQQQSTVADLQKELKRIKELEEKLEKTVPVEIHQNLEKDSEKDRETIRKLQKQLTRLDELEAQLRDTVSAETHRSLQEEWERQTAMIAKLERQLKASVALDDYRELEKQLEWHKATVAQLQAQLVASVSTDTHRQLEQKLERQKTTVAQLQSQWEQGEAQIAELQEKIKQLSDLEVRLAHSVPAYQYTALEEQSEQDRQVLAGIRKQLLELAATEDGLGSDSPINPKQLGTADTVLDCCDRVKRKLNAQVSAIAALQTRVRELQGLAMMAESHLSKWSHRTFSNNYR
ncbi:MAG: CopG family transcriptional regulator [Limnospira sp.]